MTDTSELYRQMCDTPEVQEGHEWEEGDWFAVEHTYWCCGLAYVDCKKPRPVDNNNRIPYMWGVGVPVIFLPDIRWYLERIPKPYTVVVDGMGFTVSTDKDKYPYYSVLDNSLEVALLKFYMHTVHHKRWKKGKWVAA